MKHYFFLLLAISLFLSLPVKAEDYLISTPTNVFITFW